MFKEGHFFLHGAEFMLVFKDMEGICILWVVIFYVAGMFFVTLSYFSG